MYDIIYHKIYIILYWPAFIKVQVYLECEDRHNFSIVFVNNAFAMLVQFNFAISIFPKSS